MLAFNKFTLDNGLRVLVHEDPTTPTALMNILYDVGARDEHPEKTGFAHLFEHLMFEGSKHVPDFDRAMEQAGGRNNAFTNNDMTNYYDIIPAKNIETLFWLESDRMMSLDFNPEKLAVQKKVVIEEFKERYLNQPYGDVDLKLRPLAYKKHPYRWSTIGKKLEHIEKVKMKEVKDFFFRFYRPNNAILTVAGAVSLEQVKSLAQKWFGEIPAGDVPERKLPAEPPQTQPRTLNMEADVAQNAIYKAYHMCSRREEQYYVYDLISDILANGQSSRLYQNLVKEQQLFSEIDAYITGSLDDGLLIIEGKLHEGISMDRGEQAIKDEVSYLSEKLVADEELQKAKNKVEARILRSTAKLPNKAFELSYFELLGDAALFKKELDAYNQVNQRDIQSLAEKALHPLNCSTVYYWANKNEGA